MADTEGTGERVVATNRKARHNYTVLDTLETGLVLKGTEVKSLRQANVNLAEGYAQIKGNEVWLIGVHISPYKQGNIANVDPLRERKLLMHRKEIRRLLSQTLEKGVTLIPLKIFFKANKAKLLLGVCKGKREYDRRHEIAKREAERSIRRMLRR
ncbi:MAG: SsrA-binding protein SmpB [Bacteroidota bacterium]|jgi:SsrA-binding protein